MHVLFLKLFCLRLKLGEKMRDQVTGWCLDQRGGGGQLTGGCLNLFSKMYDLYLSVNISTIRCVSCKWGGCVAGVGKGTG